jgi:hypothetical protein
MKLYKPLLLMFGLLVAGAAFAAVPDDFKESPPVPMEQTIDLSVDIVDAVLSDMTGAVGAPAVEILMPADQETTGISFDVVVWKDPDRLRKITKHVERATNFKLKEPERRVKTQISNCLKPPLRE